MLMALMNASPQKFDLPSISNVSVYSKLCSDTKLL